MDKKNKKRKKGRWPKTATGSCVVQNQAPQQWWSIRSALQPDRWCNSGTSTMLAHSRAIIAYGDGRSKVQGVCRCVSAEDHLARVTLVYSVLLMHFPVFFNTDLQY